MTIASARLLRDSGGEIVPGQFYDRLWDRFISHAPPFLTAVSLGLVPGYSRASSLGYNPDIDTATVPEDAWPGGGLFNWITSPTMCQVRSTDANDTAGGTGLQSVTIAALDGNLAAAPVTVALAGTTPVPLAAAIGASNGMSGAVAGAAEGNIGTIILEDVVGGTVRGIILPGMGVAMQAPYVVPAGNQLIIPQILLDVNSPGGAVNQFIQLRSYFKGPGSAAARTPLILGTTNVGPYNHIIDPPIVLPEKFRFSLRLTVSSDNNAVVTAGWNGMLRTMAAPT